MIGRKALRFGILAGVVAVFTIYSGFNDSSDGQRHHVENSALAMKSSLGTNSCTLAASVVQLTRGTRQQVRGMMERPTRRAETFADWCYGFVPVEPSQCIQVLEAGNYVFEATATGGIDAIMVLRSPQQGLVYCDDDSGGELRPRLEVQLLPGSYEVYVGTYSEGEAGPFTLSLSNVAAPR